LNRFLNRLFEPLGSFTMNTTRTRPTFGTVTLRTVQAAALAAALTLSGCAMIQQNPSSNLKPVNAVADGADSRVMLKGHDVVAYFTQGKHALGSAQHSSVYQDVTFRFASADHKTMFDSNPTRFLPQYGGYCANGIVYGIPWGGDADTWQMIDGKLYIFGGQGSKDGFLVDVPGNMKLAEKYWAEEVAGNNSFIQRAKRLTFKVPHYKSGEQIAKEVAATKAKKS
jgi:YHS domain-containing protein